MNDSELKEMKHGKSPQDLLVSWFLMSTAAEHLFSSSHINVSLRGSSLLRDSHVPHIYTWKLFSATKLCSKTEAGVKSFAQGLLSGNEG